MCTELVHFLRGERSYKLVDRDRVGASDRSDRGCGGNMTVMDSCEHLRGAVADEPTLGHF